MDYLVRVNGHALRVRLDGDGPRVDESPEAVELAPAGAGCVRTVWVGPRSIRVIPTRNGRGEWMLEFGGTHYRIEVLDPGEEAIRQARKQLKAKGPARVVAPMPGLVVRVEVSAGAWVEAGEGLLIVEAMKMENELRAPISGRIDAVHVAPGDTVEKAQVLVEIEPKGEAEKGEAE